MLEGFVVTGKPLFGSDHTSVDVVSHQVFGKFRRLPLQEHRGLGVPAGNNLTGSRGDACSWERSQSLIFVIFQSHQFKIDTKEHIKT